MVGVIVSVRDGVWVIVSTAGGAGVSVVSSWAFTFPPRGNNKLVITIIAKVIDKDLINVCLIISYSIYSATYISSSIS